MGSALARHDTLVRTAVAEHHGVVVKMIGDGAHAVFADPLDALLAASQILRALDDPGCNRGCGAESPLRYPRGLVERRDDDYFGSAVNRAARIMSAAHGGQLLLSQRGRRSRGRPAARIAISLRDLGSVRLRDLASPERIYQLLHPAARHVPRASLARATPNNLPQQVTSFVGRERELAEVPRRCSGSAAVDALRRWAASARRGCRCRLPPTCSTTIPDGVWFVELAAGRGPRAACRRPSRRCSASWRIAGRPVVEALVRYVDGPATAADPRQLRARDRRVRGIGQAVAAGEPGSSSWRRAASRCASPARRRIRYRRSRFPDRTPHVDWRRCSATTRCACSPNARPRCSRRFAITCGKRGGDRRHLPPSRRHSARDRTCRGARPCAERRQRSPSAWATASAC